MNTVEKAATVDLGWGTFPASRLRYMVRTCRRDADGLLRSSIDTAFIWPSAVGAVAEALDWRPDDACGGGLHGLQAGQQSPGVWITGPDAVWMVVAYDVTESVDFGGKTKVRRCRVEMVIAEADGAATAVPLWLRAHGIIQPVYRGAVTVGNFDTAITGDYGYAVAGYRGMAIAGIGGTAMAGGDGTIMSYYFSRGGKCQYVGHIGIDNLLPNVPYCVDTVNGVPRWARAAL